MISKSGYLLISCLKLTGGLFTLIFVLSLSLYNLLFIALAAYSVFFVVLKFSLKAAASDSVESVLGPLCRASTDGNDVTNGLKVIAHRGCGLDAPENTIAALKNIGKEGIKVVEFDVMLTADNVPVVFHDDSLNRMTESSELLKNVTWNDLQELDLSKKHPFGKLYPNEKIPTMEDFVNYCLKNQTTMIIDVKDCKIVPFLVEMFDKQPELITKAVVSSFDPTVIYKIRKANEKIVGCLAWRPFNFSHREYSAESGPKKAFSENPLIHAYHSLLNIGHSWLLWNFFYHLLGLSAILLHKDMITRDVIQHWKARGVRVLAWTVNSPLEKNFFDRVLQIPYLTDTVIGR